MSHSDISLAAGAYLRRVEELLVDIDQDDLQTLMADLGDQIGDLTPAELANRLGTPEDFATEYRQSAGIASRSEGARFQRTAIFFSILGLPFGVAILFSFGGQLVLGPFVLAIEWILARISPRPLRIAWSVLAGVLVGEIAYLVVDVYVPGIDGALGLGLLFALAAPWLFYRTTTRDG